MIAVLLCAYAGYAGWRWVTIPAMTAFSAALPVYIDIFNGNWDALITLEFALSIAITFGLCAGLFYSGRGVKALMARRASASRTPDTNPAA